MNRPRFGRVSGSAVVGRALDQPVLIREARGLGAVRDAELAVDVREVELDRLFRDPELLADCLVRESAGKSGKDRGLALGEAGRTRGALAGIRQPDRAVDGAVDRLAERRGEVDRVDALDDEGARAALEHRL